jgi:serine/threonine protein phosphatase PrpC
VTADPARPAGPAPATPAEGSAAAPAEPSPAAPAEPSATAPTEPSATAPTEPSPTAPAERSATGPLAGDGAVRCPSCGAAYGPQDSFCEACGTELAPAALSSGAAPPERACPSCRSAQISQDGYCDNCGHKVPSGRDHQELDLGLLAGVTDRGLRHHRNEDAMALATAKTGRGPAALAVVCDGVSSSDRPDEASLAAAEAAVRVLLSAVRADEDLVRASVRAVRAAGEAVAALVGLSGDAPSATYVSAVLAGDTVTLCWLGDSRAYWLAAGDGAAKRLTTDDSVAEQMVLAGLLSEDEALAAPQAHVVTRWVGGDARESAPHVARFKPPGPGVLLLCSDGLWNYQPRAAELARLALPEAELSPLGAAVRLVRFALDAGGMDNITAVLAPFRPSPEPAGDAALPVT